MLPDGPGSDGPFFIADLYALDLGAYPNFDALVAAPNVVGVILKATQGVQYAPPWFLNNWERARAAGGDRYGDTWFRGAYHFAMPTTDGGTQADFFLDFVDRAGGWGDGDLPPIWDIEGSAWTSKQQIIDSSSQFAARVFERTGKTPILYTGAAVRDNDITDHMGFRWLWTPHLNMSRADWSLDQYALWQYAGDGKLYNPASAVYGFPLSIPGWGATDMNVVLDQGGIAHDMDNVRSILLGRDRGLSTSEIVLVSLASMIAAAGAFSFDRWLNLGQPA